jgi:hypothetical protein
MKMAKPKLNNTGSFVRGFSIDKETEEIIKELAELTGLNNYSAVVRLAVRKLYMEFKK